MYDSGVYRGWQFVHGILVVGHPNFLDVICSSELLIFMSRNIPSWLGCCMLWMANLSHCSYCM